MGTFDWTAMASAAVVPVVVVSASALLCLALYNRLAAVVSRLRVFERERIEAAVALAHSRHEDNPSESLRHEKVLDSLGEQVTGVTRRAVLLQRALLSLLTAIASLVLCSLSTALATVLSPIGYAAGVFFLSGLVLLLVGVSFAIREMLGALEPVRREEDAVRDLTEILAPPEGGAGGGDGC